MNGYVDGYLVYSDATKTVLLGCSTKAIGEIVIPNSATSIRDSAFSGCSSLISVEIPNSVTSIGINIFANCTSLTAVTIPNSIVTIGESTFSGCTSLASIEIPNSVTSIEYHAFEGCTSLASIEIPNSVTSIGSSVFDNVSGKIIFSKLYSTYTNKIFSTPTTTTSIIYNVEFNISEIPTGYNISSILPQVASNSSKGGITYNIYTDYAPCKDQALALVTQKTIVNVYHIDGTPWE